MPYEESFTKVKEAIMDALRKVPFVLQDPEPIVGIESYDTHNVIISIRPFITPDDYWDATFAINSKIKESFYQKGIKMAYSEGVELGPIGPG
jgi:small conductance mechanosensitive channel